MSEIRVTFVEDDGTFRRVLQKELEGAGFKVHAFPSAEDVEEDAREFQPQVALLDLKLGGRGGLELLRDLRSSQPDLQVVLLTGHGGVPEAVEAMRLGAYDFLTKPVQLEVLERTLRRAAEKSALLLENRLLRRAVSGPDPHRILGSSAAVEELRRLIARIGPVNAPVLIEGENGTGKELIARNLHRLSARHERPWVVLNCAAIASELVENELFGHERGAFTGADRRQEGLFESADGGTLFLDEVGELPLVVQPALLRALQFGEIRPVGSSKTRSVDVRIIAATNRKLREEIAAGRFREDLFYRLATFRIHAPPLRERPEDIAELAVTFLEAASLKTGRRLRLDAQAVLRLMEHHWSGNTRELESAITRLSVLAPADTVTSDDVDRYAFERTPRGPATLPTLRLDELERMATIEALKRNGGDKPATAEALGVSLRTLYNKLKQYDLP